MRHGWSVAAPRHGAVMALTRRGLSLFALLPRPLVMRYGWSGFAPRHQCAMRGWSLFALLQLHVVRRGPQGLTLSLTMMRKASRTISPRDFQGPALNTVVRMTSCWLRHLALISHHSRWIVPRIITVELVSFAIGKRRVPRGPYPLVMVSPVGLGRAIRVLLRPLVMRTVVGCDVPGVRRCPPLIRKVLSGWTRIMSRTWILCYGIPARLWTRMERTSRWWVRTYRPSRCWFPRFLSWTHLLLRPVRQGSRHQILNLPWGNLWIWWSLPRTSPLSRLSPSISGETIQYEIGCRDPLRLEVRDGGRRVSIPDGRSHQRKDFSHDSRRNSRSRSRSPLRTESSSRRTSRSARSRRERRHSQSSTSRQRVSDDDGSDIMVSPSRYSIFRNAVRTSRGAYTSVNPRGEGLAKASMVHLSQDDKPEKVAWSVQPQLRHAIDHVSMLAQGVKKIDKVAKTPLCEHTSRESSFKFLKPNEVFDRKENFRLKVDPDSDFPIKPPHLDGSLGSFTMPASFNVPAACVSASEELSRRAAVYGSIADVMFSSIIHSLAPEDERAPLLKERITIAAEASMRSITASVAVASNMQLVRRDVVLDHLLLNQSSASRARTAPFSGTHLMGPDPNRFYEEIMKLREQQVLHGGLSANFRNPAALGTAQSRSVWNRAQTNNRPRGTGARGRQPFRRPSTTARQGQQQGQSRQQRGQPQRQQGRGGFNRRGRRSRSNRNESAPGGSASAARHWDVAGRGSPDKFCPAVAESVRRLPCVSHAWERSAVGMGISTSTHQNTHLFQHQEYAQGLADGSGQALVQRGNRASVPSRNQGFLQPSLPGAEKDRGFTSCHRSLPLERPSGYSAVQDGDPGFSPGFHQRERMDCVHRHTGRISSRSHGKVCTEIPQIHGKRACVSVYMPPVRLGYLSSGVYQVAATSGPASAAPRYQAPCISGRLAHPSIVHRTGQNSCRFSPAGVTTPWMGNQFQQVRLGSQPAVRFYRHAVQHVRLHRGTSTQNAGQNPEHPGSLEITPAHIRQGSPQTFGYVDIHGHSGAKRSTTPPPNPVVGVRGMVPGDGVLVRQDFSDSDHSPSGGLVGLSCGAAGGFTECPRDRDNFIHRCLQSRMGGAAGLPYAARDVVSTAGKPAYKSVRDGGSVSECNSVPASTQVSGSAPDVRQRRGCFVHQQGRRDQIVQTDSPDDSALEILRPEGHQASACSSSRITQHPGRCSVASGPDSCDGVGHQWPASSSGVLCMGNTSDRSVRNFCQQEAACLRITISGPEGQIRRCDVSTVVRDGNGVRLPTIQDAAGCPQQDPQVSQPVGDLNSSTPDVSIMDVRAIRAVSLSSNTTGRASTSYSRSSAAQRSRRDKTLPTLKSTRLATLKGLFVKLGYSRRVAECMSTNLRPSSIGCYESHWSRFVEYCRRKHLNVFEVDSRIFSKYLLHLFENERYAPSTIISHRTSIASVLRHWKYDPATDPRLRALLRNFQLARPVQRRLMPQWDLHLVLTALLRPPFTDGANDRPSDDVIDLKWRTLKTTFLLALATARRRSFLHALCVSTCLFTRGDVQDQLVVNLLPQEGFLAKTQLPDQAPQWIRIPGIAHLNPGELERMLCSVRQLQLYLRDTERIRGGRTRLLLHWDPLIDDIQRTHVSRWLVEVVKEAYTRADLEYDDDIRAHELRAIASSWAYVNQVRLEDILAAASWRSSGVFQGSYLRDMSSIADGMATLGPIVAAQHVVCTRRQ